LIIYKNKKGLLNRNLTILFSCGKMKISTKKHQIIFQQNWKQLEINVSEKFLLEEISYKYVKKYIR
jgi:hypothetical protein